ncbi:hypothetical protein GUJ93_ZPchr0001g31102 [Zizania palustris]|uniref:Flavodoxin-like domain-containing protein n=1 Tax=Zizania palustris TaxID=103762 RepID=A0A8J5V943_ZIZPA|nr:hypothetical protein GUJ93_ZPchr0001g31102 [Zizania palustris]
MVAPPSTLPEVRGRLLVNYASHTGNAMDAADRVGREAERGGCPAVDVLPKSPWIASIPVACRERGSWFSSCPLRGRVIPPIP